MPMNRSMEENGRERKRIKMEECCKNRIPDYFMTTKVKKSTYYFKWLIEDFSSLSSKDLRSESFNPKSSNYKYHVTFGKRSLDYAIGLLGVENESMGTVTCKMIISDGQGKKLFDKLFVKKILDLDVAWEILDMRVEADVFKDIPMSTDKIEINLFLNFVTETTVTKQESDEESFQSIMKDSLVADLITAYDNQIGTDVTLTIQADSVQAHRGILCARSPVFAKMFQQDMAETQKSAVDIKDIGMPALKELLNYMYSKGRRNYDFQTALQVYYAADKYEVIGLRDICGEVLCNTMSPSNATEVLLLAHQHNDKLLKTEVMKYFTKNWKSCLKENCWFELRDNHSELFKETMEFTDRI